MNLLGKKEELPGTEIKGRLIKEYNKDFLNYIESPENGFNMIKKIYFKITDVESINKIYNVIKKWKINNTNFKIPLYKSDGNSIIIYLCSQKFAWTVGPQMIENKKNKKEWIDKTFTIKFDVKSYNFPSQKTIEGLQFIIKYIDLEI